MSSRGGKKARLSRALDSHIRNIEETFQILVKSVAEKVEWSQVIKLGDEVSKQATIAGMLWSGEEPEIKQVEENMEAYFNVLHGFVLLCHNSAAGAGPTLHASICSSARRVIDSSLALLKESVSIESHKFSNKSSIPRLSGSVWEACANLKKTPTSNCAAIGRAIARVAVSVKDILREMNELKPAAPNTSNDALREEDDSDDEEFGADLSPEEMLIVQLTIKAVSDVLVILKEAIRFVSGLHDENVEQVNGLETLLRCCQDIGNEANELGASVYPPQEISMLKSTSEKIYIVIDEMKKVVEMVGGSDQSFLGYFERLEDSLKKMESGLCGNLINEIERLAL